MDSGPSPSSFPHSSDVGGSSNTSRFRLSELLNSSSNERTRTSSLKGRQAQRDSSRSSRIYGQCYTTSLALHTTHHSKP